MMTRGGIQERNHQTGRASRIVALDDLWRIEEDNKEEKEDEEAKKVFVKSLASVNVISEEEGTTMSRRDEASVEKYWGEKRWTGVVMVVVTVAETRKRSARKISSSRRRRETAAWSGRSFCSSGWRGCFRKRFARAPGGEFCF